MAASPLRGSTIIVSVGLNRALLRKTRASDKSCCVFSSDLVDVWAFSHVCPVYTGLLLVFYFTLTELLSLPLDIPALMIHTWINHTARQTAAHSMIMQNREAPLGHAISTTACFLTAASMIIRRTAVICATDMHRWAATIWSPARKLISPPKLMLRK